jgi:pimeloyl-ACP methyl ester carboxylesterase
MNAPVANLTGPGHRAAASPLQEHRLPGASDARYHTYVPRKLCDEHPPLVFVHGYNRRVAEQAAALIPLCDALGCALVAPFFPRAVHPRYQRIARGRDGQRADHLLHDCLRDFSGADRLRFNLVGFSGGAQFAHRYTMAHPDRVAGLVAIAAGWYTLPDPALRYPIGLQKRRALTGCSLNPERFLRVPTTVIVGDRDTGTQNLRRSQQLDGLQGVTRVERARSWVVHMRRAAAEHRVAAQVSYREVPGIGHDFDEFVASGFLLELIGDALGSAPFIRKDRVATPNRGLEQHSHDSA